jgi:hypothetical protein
MSKDFALIAEEYSKYSKRDLLIELDKQLKPIDYSEPPTDGEKEASGNTLWRQYRKRLTTLICSKEKSDARKKIEKLLEAGIVAFITQFGSTILESSIGIGITLRIAATLAALLANDLFEMGIDRFCLSYGSEI